MQAGITVIWEGEEPVRPCNVLRCERMLAGLQPDSMCSLRRQLDRS